MNIIGILNQKGGKDDEVFREAMLACNLIIIPTCLGQYDLWA
ncbi:MAG: ParA family protein [Planctomycetes bacterium]|nr:ParA family protein [Planctomycetota bacterium]